MGKKENNSFLFSNIPNSAEDMLLTWFYEHFHKKYANNLNPGNEKPKVCIIKSEQKLLGLKVSGYASTLTGVNKSLAKMRPVQISYFTCCDDYGCITHIEIGRGFRNYHILNWKFQNYRNESKVWMVFNLCMWSRVCQGFKYK